MAFWGLMTVREHEAVVADLKVTLDEHQTRAHEKAMGYQESIKLALKSRDVHIQAASALRAELATLKAERERLVSDLEEARHQPWPEWATAVLKVIRSRSGNDGYDDALDGVDLPNELEETMAVLEEQAEKSYQEARVDRETEQHKSIAEHYRKQADEYRPQALKYRERLRRDREALAAKRKRAVAALPKAQAARGGDVREGV